MANAGVRQPDPAGKPPATAPTYQETTITGGRGTEAGATPAAGAAEAPAGGGLGPAEQLEAKKKERDEVDLKIAELQKKREGLNSDVQTLEGPVGETEKLVKDYAAALPRLTAERDLLAELLAQHKTEVEAVLGAKAGQVRAKAKEVDDNIAALREAANKSEGELRNAEAAAKTAKDEVKIAEDAFTALKQTLPETDKTLKAARALKDQEAKADAENDHKKKCFLLQDLEDGLNSLELKKPEELRASLDAAVTAVKEKKDAQNAANAALAPAKKAAEDARKTATTAQASRAADIQKAIAAL